MVIPHSGGNWTTIEPKVPTLILRKTVPDYYISEDWTRQLDRLNIGTTTGFPYNEAGLQLKKHSLEHMLTSHRSFQRAGSGHVNSWSAPLLSLGICSDVPLLEIWFSSGAVDAHSRYAQFPQIHRGSIALRVCPRVQCHDIIGRHRIPWLTSKSSDPATFVDTTPAHTVFLFPTTYGPLVHTL